MVRTPSLFTTLNNYVAAQLQDVPLNSLKEDKSHHELRFLANAVCVQFDEIAYLYIADLLGAKTKLRRTMTANNSNYLWCRNPERVTLSLALRCCCLGTKVCYKRIKNKSVRLHYYFAEY